MKWQLLSYPDGIMGLLSGPFSCVLHDSTILHQSGLEDILRTHFRLDAATLAGGFDLALFFSVFGDPGEASTVATMSAVYSDYN
jgi:hypothetical protein